MKYLLKNKDNAVLEFEVVVTEREFKNTGKAITSSIENINIFDEKMLPKGITTSSLDLSYKKREIDFAYQSLTQNKIPKDLLNKLESKGLTKDLLKSRHR